MRFSSFNSSVKTAKKKIGDRSRNTDDGLYPKAIQSTLEICQEYRRSPDPKTAAACLEQLKFPIEELIERVESRVRRFDECRSNIAMQKEELRRCKADILYWIDNWSWTQDPRLSPAPTNIPIILFPRQREYLLWRRDRRDRQENGIVKKSRDMGITWLNSNDHVHHWLFEPGYKGAFGSRTEDLVDRKGDMDSIFEKLRFIIAALPHWMKPKAIDDHFMKLINHDIGSSVTGEGGKNIGRGGRNSVYDVDEAEFLEQGKQVDSALSENTRVIIWTSTINLFNPSNIIREKRRKGTIPVFEFLWKQDPRKDGDWYRRRTETLDALVVATEIDMNEDAAAVGIVIPPEFVEKAMQRWVDRSEGGYEILGVDVARGGPDRTVITPRRLFWYGRQVVYPGLNTPNGDIVAAYVCKEMTSPDTAVQMDVVGIGSASYDALRRLGIRNLRGVDGGAAAIDAEGEYLVDRTGLFIFEDLRSFLFWNFRDMLDPVYGERLELPPDDELKAELCTPMVERMTTIHPKERDQKRLPYTVKYKIKVESNKKITSRIGKSLDKASSLIYASYELPNDNSSDADWMLGLLPPTHNPFQL